MLNHTGFGILLYEDLPRRRSKAIKQQPLSFWDVPPDAVCMDSSEQSTRDSGTLSESEIAQLTGDAKLSARKVAIITPASSNGSATYCGDEDEPYHVHQDIMLDYIIDSSSLSSVLGKGCQTTVRKAMCRSTHERFAVKTVLKANKDECQGLRQEASILKQLQHENIVTCRRLYEDATSMHLVLEICDGLEIYEEVFRLCTQYKHMAEAQAANIVIQVLKAISYCHANNIVHRDIKMENVRYKSKLKNLTQEIRLLDFGLATHFEPGQPMTEVVGSPMYVAPEVLEEKYDEKCDIWSIGIMTFALLCGEAPFVGGTTDQTLDLVRSASPSLEMFDQWAWNRISWNAKDFVLACLQKDPALRPSAQDLLSHPWILRYDKTAKKTHKPKRSGVTQFLQKLFHHQ